MFVSTKISKYTNSVVQEQTAVSGLLSINLKMKIYKKSFYVLFRMRVEYRLSH